MTGEAVPKMSSGGGNFAAAAGGFADAVNALSGLFGTSGTVSGSGTTSVAPENQKIMDALTKLLGGDITAGKYSKEAAIEDTKGSIQAMIKKMLQEEMPSIAGAEKTSGAYNQTTTKLLSNDLQSRMDTGALSLVLQTIKDYAGITSNLGQTAALTAKTSGTTTTQSQTSETPGLLSQLGINF